MLILLFEIYLLTLKNLHVLNFFWKNQLHSLKFLTEYSNLKFYNNNQFSTNCISLSRITRLSNWSRELFLLFLDSPVNWRKFHTGRGNTSMKFHRWTRTCITMYHGLLNCFPGRIHCTSANKLAYQVFPAFLS